MIVFEIDGEFIELFKLLKAEGLCENGAQAKAAVSSGEVLVGGQVETRKRHKLRPGVIVEYAGETIKISKKIE
ncbi:RNA-binding S4 domain-containing protein [bacterium]|nr:RNA-binding S4 domain-containing protein [bacterium]